mmetsp:Transcript_6678/g.27919  ORF Transcript_6678/g.27919 Transcript_6678/m.27919 type:complete len:278 (-) Transcript_6678:976-1809(-)
MPPRAGATGAGLDDDGCLAHPGPAGRRMAGPLRGRRGQRRGPRAPPGHHEPPSAAHLSGRARRVTAAIPADPPPAAGQGAADRQPTAGAGGRLRGRLCEPAALQCRLCRALPAAALGTAARGRRGGTGLALAAGLPAALRRGRRARVPGTARGGRRRAGGRRQHHALPGARPCRPPPCRLAAGALRAGRRGQRGTLRDAVARGGVPAAAAAPLAGPGCRPGRDRRRAGGGRRAGAKAAGLPGPLRAQRAGRAGPTGHGGSGTHAGGPLCRTLWRTSG